MEKPSVTELFVKRVPLYDTLDMVHNDLGNEFMKIVRRHNLGKMNWRLAPFGLAGGGKGYPVNDTVGSMSFDKQGSCEIMARQDIQIPFHIYNNNNYCNYTRTLKFRVNCVDGTRQILDNNVNHLKYEYITYESGDRVEGKVICWDNSFFTFKSTSEEQVVSRNEMEEYKNIKCRYVVDPVVDPCCVVYDGERYVRAKVTKVLNPMDVIVENMETRREMEVTVVDIKQIKQEHIWPRITSMRCNLYDLQVPSDKIGRILRSFGLMVEDKKATIIVKQRLEEGCLVELWVGEQSVSAALQLIAQFP